MKLEIINKEKSFLVSKKFLKDTLQFFEKALIRKKILPEDLNKRLIIVFVSATSIRNLNKKFLKKNYVTDILSFSPLQENSFGELVLCTAKIKSQAKEHHLDVEEETAYLVLHGLLHLLGYQHEQGGGLAKKMYKIQDEIFYKWQSAFKKDAK